MPRNKTPQTNQVRRQEADALTVLTAHRGGAVIQAMLSLLEAKEKKALINMKTCSDTDLPVFRARWQAVEGLIDLLVRDPTRMAVTPLVDVADDDN